VARVERWIRQQLASAVAAGNGQWAISSSSAFGKAIYQVADGAMTLTLSELGFRYEGATPAIECRYDEVQSLELASLQSIMRLRGEPDAPLAVGAIIRGASLPIEMQWPLRVYANVATVLDRIVRELA
jgi:hypothetical protein